MARKGLLLSMKPKERKLAAEHYRKAVEFAKANPGFDQELIDWYSSKAKELEVND
jgi:hypothetical protein